MSTVICFFCCVEGCREQYGEKVVKSNGNQSLTPRQRQVIPYIFSSPT